MTQQIETETLAVMFLAYSLACSTLAGQSNKSAEWWAQELAERAKNIIYCNDYTPEQVNEFMIKNFPNFSND